MLNTALAAAQAAGQILRERFGQPHEITQKGLRDFVTEADVLAQGAIVAQIQERFPGHQIVTEESAVPLGGPSSCRWFIDPLDGTTNFARGIPYFSISIALEIAGELSLGVLYEPLGDRLFQASAGQGTWLNGERLRVSERSHLVDAVLDLGWGRSLSARAASVRLAETLGPHIGVVRSMGSAALGLAAVAAGWEEIFFHPGLASWDMAAGALLVREAGGTVTTPGGEPWHPEAGGCLATNGLLHGAALEHSARAMDQATGS